MTVTFDTRELEGIFRELVERTKNVPMALVAAPYVTAVDDEINSEGQGRWPPFSEVTFRYHPHRRGGKLLRDTNKLASIQVQDQQSVGLAKIFSPAKYAYKHADGYRKGNVRIPQRDFLDINMEATTETACVAIVSQIMGGW